MNRFLYLTLSIAIAAMLLGAIYGHFPYSYYQALRWAGCGIFAYTAWAWVDAKFWPLALPFVGLAILFNPLAPFYMHRSEWRIWDWAAFGITAAGAIAAITIKKRAE